MNRSLALFAFLSLISYVSLLAETDPYPKNPNIDALHYVFRIELSDETDEIKCEASVDILFKTDGIEFLRLDLVNNRDGKGMEIDRVSSDGKELNYTHENNVLLIALPKPSVKGKMRFDINYHGVPATGLIIGENKYGDRTFFSDNWPNKGRNWMPLIDHPYDKATCEMVVNAPAHYQVVSNGLKIEETDLSDNRRITHWKQSVPIAPWLYVLGAAKFAIQYVDTFDGKSIQTWVYYQDRDAGFYDFAVPTKQALEFYSDYVGPFSYEKLANIQSNSVGGGMEAASAILYGDNSVTGERSVRWRNVVIHEIAHQWFGNAVTEYDWDDVWLSEGFATYFTLLFIEHQYGRDEFLEGLASSKQYVDAFHKENPGYTIVHDNLKDMSKVTTRQTYQKGSWILHMLRGVVGTNNFWKGIQTYYKKYKDLNATTLDFRREMEEASGMDLEKFFQQWLYESGYLKLDATWQYDKRKKQVSIEIKQVQNDGSKFEMPIEIGLYYEDSSKPEIRTIQLSDMSEVFTLESENSPLKIVLDPNTWLLMDQNIRKK